VLAEDVLDRHGLRGEALCELADGRSGEAAMSPQRPDVGKLALLGPPGHGLGRNVKQTSYLRREKVLILPSFDHGSPLFSLINSATWTIILNSLILPHFGS
jgi:hypothetical protein